MTTLRRLLRDWLLALGRWRLFAAFATAAALGVSRAALQVTPVPPFDLAILNRVHAAIPEASVSVLLHLLSTRKCASQYLMQTSSQLSWYRKQTALY